MSNPAIWEVDECSALVYASATITLGALDEALRPRGLGLGPLPVESRARTLGAALAAPRPSEATPRGRLVDRCAALDAVLPDGTAISTRLAPRKATGPDYANALLGARGQTGQISAAWMRLSRRPQLTAICGFVFADGVEALARAHALLDAGALPADLLLLDAPLATGALAAAIASAAPELGAGATLLALHLDGARDLVSAEERLAVALLTGGSGGGRAVSPRPIEEFMGRREPLALAEVFVPADSLGAAWSARRAPAMLCGLHHAGAALRSAAAALPAVAAPDRAVTALQRALSAALHATEPAS